VATTRLEVRWLPATEANDEALARVAATFADIGLDALRIGRACRTCGSSQHGKPQIIRIDGGTPIHVSLARSGDQAVVAVTEAGPVGVDVEAEGAPDITTWVRIESLVKATGHGLQLDPESISVTPPEADPVLVTWPAQPIGVLAWMFELEAPAGFTACATVLSAERPQLMPPEEAAGG
jgi:4'-phosphopantetheinyl transferase